MTESITKARPTHRAYIVKGEGEAARWIEIGAAWANRDGKGFSLDLDALPTTGRVILREITERESEGPAKSEGGQS